MNLTVHTAIALCLLVLCGCGKPVVSDMESLLRVRIAKQSQNRSELISLEQTTVRETRTNNLYHYIIGFNGTVRYLETCWVPKEPVFPFRTDGWKEFYPRLRPYTPVAIKGQTSSFEGTIQFTKTARAWIGFFGPIKVEDPQGHFSPDTAALELAEVCGAKLRMIEEAKESWALEYSKKDDAPVSPDFVQHIYDKKMPECLAGGSYSINPIGTSPQCSVSGHTISPPISP